MFSLVSARYERASLIVTSNKPFSGAKSSATKSSPQP
jgi:DNA replication protein DnaC